MLIKMLGAVEMQLSTTKPLNQNVEKHDPEKSTIVVDVEPVIIKDSEFVSDFSDGDLSAEDYLT